MSQGPKSEKRDQERIEINDELHGEITVFQPLFIKEISHGGCLVKTSFPLEINSLHELRFTLGDRSVQVRGRVRHCRVAEGDEDAGSYRSGVEFIELADRIRGAIMDFMEAIKAARRGL